MDASGGAEITVLILRNNVGLAKQAGATREEVISAVLVGLPAVGNTVTQVLPAALAAYDAP